MRTGLALLALGISALAEPPYYDTNGWKSSRPIEAQPARPVVRPDLTPARRIIHAEPSPDINRHQVPSRAAVTPAGDLSAWMESHSLATVKDQKDPSYVLIPQLQRWAAPEDAIKISTEIDRRQGTRANSKLISEIRMTQSDCAKLKGVSREICEGIKRAFKKETCLGLKGEAWNACEAFRAVLGNLKCSDLSSFSGLARLQCPGIKAAMNGMDCLDLADAEPRRACVGVSRALHDDTCDGLGRTLLETVSGNSEARQGYCEALKLGGFKDYVATHST